MNQDSCGSVKCPDRYGTLPACAPLAVGYVPFQQAGSQRYGQDEALSNGTLYPALNLPFHLKAEGSTLPDTPLAQLQALEFVMLELGHYLDTHPDDKEAFQLFQQYAGMNKSAREAYQAAHGPLIRPDAAQSSDYSWLQDPWPWNYEENEVK